MRTKTKEFRINEHKKMDNLHFLNNNILKGLFKELTKNNSFGTKIIYIYIYIYIYVKFKENLIRFYN